MLCHNCAGFCYFEPISGETFACCRFHNETTKDISLDTGLSPAVALCQKNGSCDKFQEGESICAPLKKAPFGLSAFRKKGEEKILKRMFLVKSSVKK
jgi:hypothetical protein